jgi:Putative Flp pilus-assembly TadE/G-like/Putative Tad-like Flp pilus-assembly
MTMQRTNGTRRGNVAPLLALLLIPLLGMVAFSVDIGYMICVRTELQNAADAAAMAGAEQLMQPYVNYYTKADATSQSNTYANAILQVKATAKAVSAKNTAGGVFINLQDADIKVGYFDGTTFTVSGGWSAGANFPNSVQVLARRDATGGTSSNSPVPLFFGPVLGTKTTDQQAFAQASTYTVASVTGFQNVSSLQVGMLPVTFDVAVWKDFIKNGTITGTGDQYAGASVTPDPNGGNMLQVYSSVKSVGNFGSLPLDATHTGNIQSQMVSGMTQSMLQTLQLQNTVTSTPLIPLAPFDLSTLGPTGGTVPSGSHDPGLAPTSALAVGPAGSWNWTGQTGFISSSAQTINSMPGTYLLPLFRAVDDGQGAGTSLTGSPFSSSTYAAGLGTGSNYCYNIVDFVAVQLMDTSYMSQNNNKNVYVEPTAMVLTFDQVTGTPPTITGPPTTGSLNTVFVAPRLTQ